MVGGKVDWSITATVDGSAPEVAEVIHSFNASELSCHVGRGTTDNRIRILYWRRNLASDTNPRRRVILHDCSSGTLVPTE